jgi:hypothetical protein
MKILRRTFAVLITLFVFVATMGGIAPIAYAAPGDSATLFFEDFESASFTRWNMPISPNWEVNFGSLRGIYGANVEGDTDGNDALQKSVSTAGYDNIELSYRFKADGLDNDAVNFDEVRVEYSPNGGATWATVYSIADGEDDHVDGTPTGLYHKFHMLPANAANNPNFVLRFDPDFLGGHDEVWIDDVMLIGKEVDGTPSPLPAPTPAPSPAPTPTPVPSPESTPVATPTPMPETLPKGETSFAACNDGVDNDGDGMTDVFDLDCLDYRQTLNIVTQVSGGTLASSDFPLSIFHGSTLHENTLPGSAVGVEHTNPQSGTWRIAPKEQPGYATAFSGNCDTAGTLPMGFNIYARCTVTHTFADETLSPSSTPELGLESEYLTCSDGINNDGDGLVDVFDLDCLIFRQTAEIVTHVVGGTAAPSDALMQVRFNETATSGMFTGSADIVEVTNPTAGTWQLFPTSLPNYTSSFSGDCDATGAFSMGFNTRKQCIVTYAVNG